MIEFNPSKINEIIEEFDRVNEKTKGKNSPGAFISAWQEENEFKNRYRDVLPLEKTRVKLIGGRSDYINANYVTGVDERYILTQAPLEDTIPDFWRMIDQEKIPIVVMLTRLKENGREKASRYWPKKGEILTIGQYQITRIETIKESTFSKRHLKLTDTETNLSRELVQIHFKGWPDSGVPQQTDDIHKIYELMDKEADRMKKLGLDGPITIHCSAGIGRAGTLTVARIAINQHDAGIEVKIPKLLKQVRMERADVVQTSEQYCLIYRLFEEAKSRIIPTENPLNISWPPLNSSTDFLRNSTDSLKDSTDSLTNSTEIENLGQVSTTIPVQDDHYDFDYCNVRSLCQVL